MLLLNSIVWLGSLLSPAPPQITGITTSNDTCNVGATVSFGLMGTSDATIFTWDFDDPNSGDNNIVTVEGSPPGSNITAHTFSEAGDYEVHVTFQEPGMPETRMCKKISIGKCCPNPTSSTTRITVCPEKLPYSWNGNDYTAGGTYNLSFPSPGGCDSIATLVLKIGNPAPFLGNDTTLCPGDKLLLDAGDYASYLWQDQRTSKVYEVGQEGQYTVTVQNESGCSGTDAILITFEKNCGDIYFPSAITPNHDGNNDAFGALGNVASVSNFRLIIYNRYGQVVYNSDNPLKRWDGENGGMLAANSNYVWKATYSINRRSQKFKKGSLAILK